MFNLPRLQVWVLAMMCLAMMGHLVLSLVLLTYSSFPPRNSGMALEVARAAIAQ